MSAGTDPQPRGAALRLDQANERVWQGDTPLELTPKAFAVLRHLMVHRDRLVTKDELLRTLWPEAVVSDGVLTTSIHEIRRALGEAARSPRYIQTIHRRGYRFIGTVRDPEPAAPAAPSFLFVGREPELGRLERGLRSALAGARQMLFVTGEAGIGKTALVDAFVARAAAGRDPWVAWGQCVEHHGVAEAYLPWLDALARLCRRPRGERLVAMLRRVAPLWVAQMPWLLADIEREALQREVVGAPPER